MKLPIVLVKLPVALHAPSLPCGCWRLHAPGCTSTTRVGHAARAVQTLRGRVAYHRPLTRGEFTPFQGTVETPVDAIVSCPGCGHLTVLRLRGSHWTATGWPQEITLRPGLQFDCCGSSWDLTLGRWEQR